MKVVGYCRVSTDEQAREGVSLDVQAKSIEQYSELHNHELVGIKVEAGASGGKWDRPELQAALAMLEAGEADGLLVYCLDRLTRSVGHLDRMLTSLFGPTVKQPKALLSVRDHLDTSTATGRLQINLLAVVAQWQRETTVERIKESMAHLKAQGKRVGSVPYGYELGRDGRTLVRNPAELRTVRLARKLRGSGLTLRAIGARLIKAGHKPRSGAKRWNPAQISRIVA